MRLVQRKRAALGQAADEAAHGARAIVLQRALWRGRLAAVRLAFRLWRSEAAAGGQGELAARALAAARLRAAELAERHERLGQACARMALTAIGALLTKHNAAVLLRALLRWQGWAFGDADADAAHGHGDALEPGHFERQPAERQREAEVAAAACRTTRRGAGRASAATSPARQSRPLAAGTSPRQLFPEGASEVSQGGTASAATSPLHGLSPRSEAEARSPIRRAAAERRAAATSPLHASKESGDETERRPAVAVVSAATSPLHASADRGSDAAAPAATSEAVTSPILRRRVLTSSSGTDARSPGPRVAAAATSPLQRFASSGTGTMPPARSAAATSPLQRFASSGTSTLAARRGAAAATSPLQRFASSGTSAAPWDAVAAGTSPLQRFASSGTAARARDETAVAAAATSPMRQSRGADTATRRGRHAALLIDTLIGEDEAREGGAGAAGAAPLRARFSSYTSPLAEPSLADAATSPLARRFLSAGTSQTSPLARRFLSAGTSPLAKELLQADAALHDAATSPAGSPLGRLRSPARPSRFRSDAQELAAALESPPARPGSPPVVPDVPRYVRSPLSGLPLRGAPAPLAPPAAPEPEPLGVPARGGRRRGRARHLPGPVRVEQRDRRAGAAAGAAL